MNKLLREHMPRQGKRLSFSGRLHEAADRTAVEFAVIQSVQVDEQDLVSSREDDHLPFRWSIGV